MSIGDNTSGTRRVGTAADLHEAVSEGGCLVIAVTGAIRDLRSVKLLPGLSLVGDGAGASLAFVPGADGVQLSTDNRLADLEISVDPDRRAVFNDTGAEGFDHLQLTRLSLVGNLRLLLAGKARAGLVAHLLVPELPWAACFALGAIVSPPDAVAAGAVLERLHLPGPLSATLQGESLLNDASGLVLFRFAVAAALTGTFSPAEAAGTFVVLTVGGIAFQS